MYTQNLCPAFQTEQLFFSCGLLQNCHNYMDSYRLTLKIKTDKPIKYVSQTTLKMSLTYQNAQLIDSDTYMVTLTVLLIKRACLC